MVRSHYWCIRYSEATSQLCEWEHGKVEFEKVVCPIKDGHQRAGRRLSNLSVVVPCAPARDFVWTWYSECLFQNHVLEMFRAEGFSGFDVRPVAVRLKNTSDTALPPIWELTVGGWGGLAAPESGIRLMEFCSGCAHAVYSGLEYPSRLIDERQWDGSDFFMVWPLPKFVFVTERVATFIRDRRLSGAVVEPVDALRPNKDCGYSPGRLSYKFAMARARIIGLGCGIKEI